MDKDGKSPGQNETADVDEGFSLALWLLVLLPDTRLHLEPSRFSTQTGGVSTQAGPALLQNTERMQMRAAPPPSACPLSLQPRRLRAPSPSASAALTAGLGAAGSANITQG